MNPIPHKSRVVLSPNRYERARTLSYESWYLELANSTKVNDDDYQLNDEIQITTNVAKITAYIPTSPYLKLLGKSK
jgi:hypothetical protein